MAYFMPSDIARLVLGYLKEQRCTATYSVFLTESRPLVEYAEYLKVGIEMSTKVGDLSLVDMLTQYGMMKQQDVTSIPLARLWTKLDSTLMQLKHQLAAPPAARMVINSNTPPNRVMMVNTKKAPRDVRFIGRMAASMPHEVTSEHTPATAASHTPSMPHIDPPHQPPVTTTTCARDRQMVAAATDQYSVEGTSNVVPTMLEFEGSGNLSEVDVEVTEDASQVDVEVTDDSPQVTAEGNDGSHPAEVDDTEEHGNSHPVTGTNTRSQAKIPKKVAPPTRRKSACARRRAMDTQGFQSLPRGGATSRVRGRVEDLRGDAGVSCDQTDVVGTNESEPATSATALAAGSRDGDDNDTRSPVAPAAVSRRKRGANVKNSPKKRKRSAVRKKVNDGETTPDKLTAEEQKELLDAVETVLPQLLGSMMNNRELHEKIAENINKVSGRQSSGSLPPTPHSVPPVDLDLFENQQHQVPDEWVRGAMEMTEHDPLFEGLFNILDLDDYGLETSHKPPANSTMPHVTATASTIPARNHELGAALKGNQLDSSSRPPGSACVAGSAADVSQRGTDETVESINQVNPSCSSLRVEGATSQPDLPNVAPCSPGNRPHGVTPGGDSVAVLTGAVPATTPQTELPRSTELRCTDPVDSSSFAPPMAAPLRPATPPAAVRLAKPPRSPSCAVAMLSDSRGAPSASPRPAHTCATTSKSMDATSAVPVVVAMAPASSAHPATTASHTRSPCHDSSSAEGVPWHSPLTSEHSKERGKGSPDVSNLVVDTSPRRQPRRSQTMSELSMLDVICGLVPDPVNSDPVNSDLITSDIQALSTKLMTSSDLSASNRGRQEMTEATSSLVEATDSSMPAVGSGSVVPYKGAMSAANDQCRETSEEPHDSSSVASVTMATLSGPGITMPSSSVAAITTLTSNVAGVTVPISNVAGKTMPTSSVPDTVVPMSSVASVTVPKSSVAGVIMPTSSVASVTLPKSSVASVIMPTSSVPDTFVPMSSVASVTVPKSSVVGVIMPTSSVAGIAVPTLSVASVIMPTSSVPDTVVPTLSVAAVVMPMPSIPAISVPTSGVASVTMPTSISSPSTPHQSTLDEPPTTSFLEYQPPPTTASTSVASWPLPTTATSSCAPCLPPTTSTALSVSPYAPPITPASVVEETRAVVKSKPAQTRQKRPRRVKLTTLSKAPPAGDTPASRSHSLTQTNDVALRRQSATEAPSADNNGIVTDSTLDCRRAGALAERSMDFDVVLPSMIGGERQQLSTINLGDLEEDSCGVGASRDGTAAPSGCCRTLPETTVETSSLQQPLRAAHATSQKLDPAAGYCSHGRSSEDTRPSITVDLSGALLTASLERMSTAPSGSGKNGLERSPKERFLQSLYLSPRTLRAMAAAKRNDMRSRGMMEDGTASGVAAVHGTASSTISVVQVNSCGVSGPAVTHGDHHEATQRHLCEFDAASSDTSYIDRVIGCPRRTAAPADGTTIHDEPITSSQLTGQSPSTPWWHTPPSCTTDNILSLNSPRRPRILSRTPRRHLAASTPSSVSKQLRFGNIGSGLGAASVRDALAGGASVGDKPTGGVGICVPRTAGAGVDVPPTGPGDASVCVTATGDSSISVTSAGDSSVTVIDTGDSSVTVIDTGGASISVTPERNPAQLCADITTTTHVSRNRILSCQVEPLDGACIPEPIQTNPASGIPVQGCQQVTTQANMSIQPPLQQEQLVSSGHREGTNTVLDFIGGAHADNAAPKPSDGAWLQLVSGLSVLPQSASVMTSYSNELPGMALLASACYPCPSSVDTQVLPPSVTTEQLTIEHGGVSSSARQFGTHVLPPAGDEVLGRHGHGEANEVDLLVGAARTPQKTGSRMLQYLTWSPGFGKSVPAAAVMSSPKSAISETTTAAATTKTTRRRAAKIKPAAATSVKRKKVETRAKTSRKASGCVARQHNTEAVVPITVPRAMQRRVHPILPRISMPLQLSMPIVMAPTLQVLPAAHLYRAPITPAFLPQPVAVATTMPRVSSAQKTTRPFRDMSCRREPRASRRRSTPATPSGTSRRATKHAELPPAAMPAGGASSHDTSGGTAALVGSPSAASQARGGAPPSMPSLDEESQAQLPLDVVFQLFGLSPVKPSTAETDDARISTTSSETLKPSTADAGDKSISVTSSETPGSATMLTSSETPCSATMLTSSETPCSATMLTSPERVKVAGASRSSRNKVPPRGKRAAASLPSDATDDGNRRKRQSKLKKKATTKVVGQRQAIPRQCKRKPKTCQSQGSPMQGSPMQGRQQQGSQKQGSPMQGRQQQGSQKQGSQKQGSQKQGSRRPGRPKRKRARLCKVDESINDVVRQTQTSEKRSQSSALTVVDMPHLQRESMEVTTSFPCSAVPQNNDNPYRDDNPDNNNNPYGNEIPHAHENLHRNDIPHGDDNPHSNNIPQAHDKPHSNSIPHAHDNPHSNNIPHAHDNPHSNNIPYGHDIPHSNNIPHGHDIPQAHDKPHSNSIPQAHDKPHSNNIPYGHDIPHSNNIPHGHDIPHSNNIPHGHDIPHSNNIPHGHDIPHSNNIPHGDDIPQHPPTGQSELSSPGGMKVGLGGAESATPRKSGRDEEEEAAETLVALSCTPTKRIKPPDSTKHAATPAKHAPAAARSSDDRSTGVSPASGDTCRRSPRAVPLVAGADNADFARRVMEVVMPAMTDIIAGNRTRGLPPGGIVDATARAVERTVSLANLARVQSQAADAARRRVSPGGAHTSQQGNAVQDVSGTDSRSATGVHQPPGVGGRIDAQRNASAESEIERVTAQDRATEGAMNRDCRRAEKENKVEAGKMLEKSRKTSSRGKSRESWQKVDVDKFLSKLHYHE